MLCVGRNQDVAADIHTSTRALFESDDRQPVKEVVEHLFALGGGLLRDSVANLSGRRQDASVVADLRETSQDRLLRRRRRTPGDSHDPHLLRGRSFPRGSRPMYLSKSRERNHPGTRPRWEGDEHLPLLGIAHALHVPNKPSSLRHKKLLVVVRVVVGSEHDEYGAR